MVRKMQNTNTILDQIFENKKKELESRKNELPLEELNKKIEKSSLLKYDFKTNLKRHKISLIAEIKKASPSLGLIREDFNHITIAKNYQESGADAISVITDNHYFQGDISFIEDIKRKTCLPIIRKDFIFDEYQVYESKAYGADAILLIAGILSREELKNLISLAKSFGMDCLVETHTYLEIEKAIESGAEIIGINNRDLRSFNVDINNFVNLSRFIPKDKIIVCESGIFSRADALRAKHAGANAILVGTSLMISKDIKSKIKELLV